MTTSRQYGVEIARLGHRVVHSNMHLQSKFLPYLSSLTTPMIKRGQVNFASRSVRSTASVHRIVRTGFLRSRTREQVVESSWNANKKGIYSRLLSLILRFLCSRHRVSILRINRSSYYSAEPTGGVQCVSNLVLSDNSK